MKFLEEQVAWFVFIAVSGRGMSQGKIGVCSGKELTEVRRVAECR